LRRPDFQIAILERNRFPNGAAGINRGSCRKKNQMVRQMSEEHDNKVCQANYEQLRNRWNNSWPHIPLAHETHEVHERKSTKNGSTEIFRVFSRVSWAKGNCDETQRRDKRFKSADHYC